MIKSTPALDGIGDAMYVLYIGKKRFDHGDIGSRPSPLSPC